MTDPAPSPLASRAEVPLRNAATVMLVRNSERGEGVEVFMLRRTLDAVFARGYHVFPGGKVDEGDGVPEVERWCAGRDDAAASGVLGAADGGLAVWVAAEREWLEGPGVVLAATPDGQVIPLDDPDVRARVEQARHDVHQGRL